MPPQPLSFVSRSAKIYARPFNVSERPECAALVSDCIAMWANVEFQLGLMMTVLLGKDAIPTVAVYLDIIPLRTRMTALKSAASWTVCKEHYQVCDALLSICLKESKKRDRLAHHIWTGCDELPKSLLLIDPRDLLPVYALGIGKVLKNEKIFEKAPFKLSDISVPSEKVFVYKAADLKEIVERYQYLINMLIAFNNMILNDHDIARQYQIYDSLSREPQIHQFLTRLSASRTTQEEPQSSPAQAEDGSSEIDLPE